MPPAASRVAVAILFLMNGGLFGTWVSRIPAVQTGRGLSHATLGLALLAIAAGALVAMPLAGRLAARFGSHRVCQLCAVFYALALPMLAIAPGFMLFVTVLVGFGACHGALDVAMNAQAVVVEKRYRRPIMSSFHALFSVGGLAGAAIGGLVASFGVSPTPHFIGAAVTLLAVAVVIAFPHLIPDQQLGSRREHSKAGSRFSLPPRALLAIGAVAFCAMVGEGAMADWSGVFLKQALQASDGFAAAGYAAFSATMVGTRLCGDALSTRLGPVNLVRLSGAVAVLGMIFVLVGPSPGMAMLGFALVGAGFATVVPVAFSAAGRASGVSPSAALATVTTIGYLGFLVGPPIIGFVAEWLGLRGALALIVISSGMIFALAPAVRGDRERLA